MQEAHAHAGGTCTCRDRGGAVSLVPRPMETLLDGMRLSENSCQHNHDLSYYFDHTESGLVSINPIGEIKFSIGDGDEVRHNKISIDSLYVVLINKEEDHSLGVGGLGCVVFCGLDVPIEGDELLRVVLNPGLTDQFVTYQPEHPWVGFHLGNLLCHGEWDLDLRESLVCGLDCLLESLCLG